MRRGLVFRMDLKLNQWIILLMAVCVSQGVQVSVQEEQRVAMLFQSVVLQCRFHTASSQTPVVQWWFKSYCHDRTRDAFTFPESLGVRGSEPGQPAHLECSDSSRTVRIVASGQGPSMTLAEHYKGRDIAIVDKADLRIGELRWGDSGVYFCKVVIADDLEGKNEAQVELLVLGSKGTGGLDDLLPGFDVEVMPEWVFVGAVVLGSVLVLVLAGVCWCQCCPHSCCCYLRCPCCPDTCCCPRHPSSLSELSSLHEGGDTDFRQTYRTVQMKALPPIADLDDQSEITAAPPHQSRRPLRHHGNHVDEDRDSRWNPRSEHLQRRALGTRGRTGSLDELEEFARSYGPRARRGDHAYDPEGRGRDPYPRSYRDDSPPRRHSRDRDDDWHRRSPSPTPQKRRGTWDSDRPPRPAERGRGYDDSFLNSLLERKARGGGRADEDSDTPSKGSSKGKGRDYSRSPSRPEEEDLPPYCEFESGRNRKVEPSTERFRAVEPPHAERYRAVEPPHAERYRAVEPPHAERYRTVEPPQPERYRPVEPPHAERYRTVEPPHAERYRAAEPSQQERYRTTDPSTRPFSYTRPPLGTSHTPQGGGEERDRNRNLSPALSRETLIV